MKFISIKEKADSFYTNNKAVINSIIIYGACLFIGKKFGIKFPGINTFTMEPQGYKAIVNEPKTFEGPRNSLEQAITEVCKNGVEACFDSTKLSCVDKIVDLLSGEQTVTDRTLSYALTAMGKISQGACFDKTKASITSKMILLRKNATIIEEKLDAPSE